MKQFEEVSHRYGTPMGRREYGIPTDAAPRSIHLFRVRFVDGDCDDGGAYWGAPIHGVKPLYCARDCARDQDGAYLRFVRASSREEAARELCIPRNLLARPGKREAEAMEAEE